MSERDSVSQFYSNPQKDSDYITIYRLDHQPRMKALLDRYGLVESLKGKRVVDIGGGVGFMGELLDPLTEYWVIDGAVSSPDQWVSKGHFCRVDLDHEAFGSEYGPALTEILTDHTAQFHSQKPQFDAAFCLETLEHLSNPYHCLSQIKKIVKIGGDIFLSVPTESVTHNVVYPGLLWPPQNFRIFLEQLALPVVDFYIYQPKDRGWPAYQYRCVNRPWSEKRLLFPKTEQKFVDCTALEATNL